MHGCRSLNITRRVEKIIVEALLKPGEYKLGDNTRIVQHPLLHRIMYIILLAVLEEACDSIEEYTKDILKSVSAGELQL